MDLESAQLMEHMPLARHMAGASQYRGLPYEDRLQAATIGLLVAMRTFDPSRGRWVTYAGACIRREIALLAAKQAYQVAVPDHVARMARHAAALHARGTSPKLHEIRTRRVNRDATLASILALPGRAISYGEDGAEATSPCVDPYDAVEERLDRRAVAEALLSVLSEHERTLCRMHFAEGLTYRAIADRLGCTFQRAQQIVAAAVRKIAASLDKRAESRIPKV